MKSLSLFAVLLWISLVAESAAPAGLPHGSLLFPGIAALICWMRSSASIVLASLIILTDAILWPTPLLLFPIVAPLLMAAVLTWTNGPEHRLDRSGWSGRLPEPLQLPALAVALLLLSLVSGLPWHELSTLQPRLSEAGTQLSPVLYRVLPISAVLSLGLRVADELGLRRTAGPTVF